MSSKKLMGAVFVAIVAGWAIKALLSGEEAKSSTSIETAQENASNVNEQGVEQSRPEIHHEKTNVEECTREFAELLSEHGDGYIEGLEELTENESVEQLEARIDELLAHVSVESNKTQAIIEYSRVALSDSTDANHALFVAMTANKTKKRIELLKAAVNEHPNDPLVAMAALRQCVYRSNLEKTDCDVSMLAANAARLNGDDGAIHMLNGIEAYRNGDRSQTLPALTRAIILTSSFFNRAIFCFNASILSSRRLVFGSAMADS